MADNFWNSVTAEPKRSYRWVLTMGSSDSADGIQEWMARTAKKPSFSISNVEHPFVAHKFNFPGRVTWDPVEVTLVDPISPNAEQILTKLLNQSGYSVPDSPDAAKRTITRAQSQTSWGSLRMSSLNAAGETLDAWSLVNPWCERVDFGQWDYSSEEMLQITLSFRYDYAIYFDPSGAPAFDASA